MHTISVFGLGYVGSVTAACLASLGHSVIGVDINPRKVELLDSGQSPIVETSLPELIATTHRSGRLRATLDVQQAVAASDISFISVATPSNRTGKLNLSAMERVCGEIGQALRGKAGYHTVAVRSTILPGTAESTVIPVLERASGKKMGSHFGLCLNPEFLREGTAVADFFQPPFIVMGAAEPEHVVPLREIYDGIPGEIFETSLRVAEMVKYVCNAYHALKVSFANEIGTYCEQEGVDAQAVTDIFLADKKLNISTAYLRPGFAFGGSCLPKDIRALLYRAKEVDLKLPLLEAILPSNAEQIERAVQLLLQTNKRRIGLLGLSFKAGTDDLRESPAVQLIKRLLGEGCQVLIWDDQVSLSRLVGSNRQFIQEVMPHIGSLLCDSMQRVLEHAEVVVIGTKIVSRAFVAAQVAPEQIIVDLSCLEYPQALRAACSGRD